MTNIIPIELPIENIRIKNRFRKDMGDMDILAHSIETVGLLQPIGVDYDFYLVFGERRLRACQQLGWKDIPVTMIDLKQPLQAENDENEVRKDFTPSERVAIGRAIEEQIGNRSGRPTKEISQNIGELNQSSETEQPSQIFGEVKPGQKTYEYAAEKAGFGNPETYRQAKHVVDNAPQAIVDKMDQGSLSINKSYQVTKQLDKIPEEQRAEVVQMISVKDVAQDELTEEQQKELQRMQRFKTNLDRLIDRLNTLSKHKPHEYFDSLDYVEWAFSKITIFAEAHLETIDDALSWLQEFRKEYARRMLHPGTPVELRRIK